MKLSSIPKRLIESNLRMSQEGQLQIIPQSKEKSKPLMNVGILDRRETSRSW